MRFFRVRFYCIFFFVLLVIYSHSGLSQNIGFFQNSSAKTYLYDPLQFNNEFRLKLRHQTNPASKLKLRTLYQSHHKNFLSMDYRESSYYVPLMVQDELLHIMNRERTSDMVNIFAVAFITARIMSKYVEIEKKINISDENVLKLKSYLPILKALWQKSPRDASELYDLPGIRSKRTMNALNRDIEQLIKWKIVKQKFIDNSDTQYFPAVSFDNLYQRVESLSDSQTESDSLLSEMNKLKTGFITD